ncbi:hypothetical protein FQN60_010976 [Etheostoma spectabile]|uniref:LIM zinc-binding domain-containing protein n=1 Tax=Etheostoma spectabile TaxID=54343 RepID=A0A5J5DQM1_9PERO|nr:hypothetical protein FQN60_010976 [Etheostoma spectabile]
MGFDEMAGVPMLSVQPKGKQKGCAGCNRKIKDRYLLKALDKYWHEDCLKCACCDCRLGEVGSTLYTKANLILCRRDYLRQERHTITPLHSQHTQMPRYAKALLHEIITKIETERETDRERECRSSRVEQVEEEMVFIWMLKLRLFGTTGNCAACSKLIPAFEMVMRARDNVYHLDCFACQLCNQRFCVGDKFFLKNNMILCQMDYEEGQLNGSFETQVQ